MATIRGTNYSDKIYQDGYTAVDIFAYDGNDKIYLNNIGINGGNNYVSAGYGNDTVYNYFEGGNEIRLGAGNDLYVSIIRAGDANDYDEVFGGDGADVFDIDTFASDYFGEAGNDTFYSVGYNNYFNGGTGIDTISYQNRDDTSLKGRGVTIDLGGRFANTGSGRSEDLISIENATGTNSASDDITGSSVGNVLKGLGGNDELYGLGGNDLLDGGTGADDLFGGTGNDVLRGSTGYDYLTGGSGADTFDFNSYKDSAVGSTRDVITDFSRASFDLIDLSGVDADWTLGGNQRFDYIGSRAFTGEAGELNFRNGIVSADMDGDGLADFQIKVNNVSSLRADDFVL